MYIFLSSRAMDSWSMAKYDSILTRYEDFLEAVIEYFIKCVFFTLRYFFL